MLLLRCPKCGNEMKYQQADSASLAGKRKQCVYCGRGFKVGGNVVKQL